MSANGDTLWAWQSQQEDGSWSIIAQGIVEMKDILIGAGPRYTDAQVALVLVHRNYAIVTGPDFRAAVRSHRMTHKQIVRLARFELVEVEEMGAG